MWPASAMPRTAATGTAITIVFDHNLTVSDCNPIENLSGVWPDFTSARTPINFSQIATKKAISLVSTVDRGADESIFNRQLIMV